MTVPFDEPFIIPGKSPKFNNDLERDLHNLEIRLKMQQEWVAKTEKQIAEVKERLKNNDFNKVENDSTKSRNK